MISETYKIGASNNLWIRSCGDDGIDVNRVSSVNPLYLTQDPDYAYYYCMSKKTDDCILVVKVQDGELCHLYDANDYTALAKKSKFPSQMADIFKMIEPYFSFNTTPSINVKRGRVPDQYKEAAKFTIDFNKKNGVKSKSIVQLMLDSRYVDCGNAAVNEDLDDIVVGYAQAFDVVHDYIKTVPGYVKHKYVDILQFAFFDMLNKKLGYKGYYCPENSRHSRSYMSTDYKKDKYYFGHDGHTHPCIAMFDGSSIEVVAIVPKDAFYIEFSNIVDKDSRMLRYSNRATAIAQVVAQYNKNKGDIFADRRYSDENVKHARHKIMQVINAKSDPITGDLPKEKRSRDQI